MKRYQLVLSAAFLFASGAAAQDSISMEPGQWNFENSMSGSASMPGGGSFQMPARTTTDTECITPEDATITPDRMMRELREDGGDCEYSEISFSGLTMTTTLTCSSDDMNMTGDYTFTVAADRRSGEGRIELTGIADGMNINSVFNMTGAYVGACNAG